MIFNMKQKINYMYLIGGLIILAIGVWGYFMGENTSNPVSLGTAVIGIIYLLYSAHIVLSENKYVKLSFFLIFVSIVANAILFYGANNGFWPGALGAEVSTTSTTYLFFLCPLLFFLGFILLMAGLIVGLFKKRENTVS